MEGLLDCHKAKGSKTELEVHHPIHSKSDGIHVPVIDLSSLWTETPLDDLLAQTPARPCMTTSYSTTNIYNPVINYPILSTPGDLAFQDEATLPMPPKQLTQRSTPRPLRLFPSTKGASKAPSVSRSALSTYISTSSIKRRLPQYPVSYLKKIVRLLDTHSVTEPPTTATTIDQDHSISANLHDGLSESAGWYSSFTAKQNCSSEPAARSFPDTFLVLDRCIKRQGICIPGLKPHDTKSCWCAILVELGSSRSEFWSLRSLGHDFDINLRDEFHNSVLHLLSARGASWSLILEVIEFGADVNAKNVADQNFLHVLEPCALQTFVESLRVGRVGPEKLILQKLNSSGFEFNHCDFFGCCFFHSLCLNARTLPHHPFSYLTDAQKLPSNRDAFGRVPNPNPRAQVGSGDVFQIEGLLAPDRTSNLQPVPKNSIRPFASLKSSLKPFRASSVHSVKFESSVDDRAYTVHSDPASVLSITPLSDEELWKHAKFIETARLARSAPWIEESEGRNGLQCLAEAILDIHIEDDEAVKSHTTKRKRGQPGISPTSQRLSLRYRAVKNLVSQGVDLNHYDNYGSTVLMTFVTHLHDGENDRVLAEILTHLIQNGANVHWRNRKGETALHIAIRLGRKVATRVLLAHGANIYARNSKGKGVLLKGQAHYFKARNDPQLYASIMLCMALAIDYGAVALPTIVQEWSP
jgi:ankyrin repeat protein